MAVDQELWTPIFISHEGPPITHLCFADDLFIFAEASMSQVDVIKGCLDTFGKSSSQKVSLEKTHFFFFW